MKIIDADELKKELLRLGFYPAIVAGAIERLERKSGWIPCSERLPEDDEKVLVTDEDGMVYPEILWYGYADSDDEKMCFHRWDDELYNLYIVKAVAWMPLPEPWKGE